MNPTVTHSFSLGIKEILRDKICNIKENLKDKICDIKEFRVKFDM